MLGGRDFQTITPMILTFANSPTSRDLAALLAIILGVATIVMLAVMTRLEKGGTYFSVSKVSSALQKQQIRNPAANAAVHAAAYLLFAVYTLPPGADRAVLLHRRRRDPARTCRRAASPWTTTCGCSPTTGLRPFVISIVYSALAAVIAVAGCCLWPGSCRNTGIGSRASFEYLLHIPWILPSALLALGLILSYDHPNPLVGGAVLTGTTVILLDRLRDREDPLHPADAQGLLRLGQLLLEEAANHHGRQDAVRLPPDPAADRAAGGGGHRGAELQQHAGRLRHRNLPGPPALPAAGPRHQGQHRTAPRRRRRLDPSSTRCC